MDFHSLTRRELQAICKKNKILANMTNVAMAEALKSLEIVEGLDEIVNQCQSPEKIVERASATASRASTRRKPTKEFQSTQPITQTRRSTRRAVAGSNDDENKHVNVPETPKMPITASRSRRVAEALNQCMMESQEVENEGKKANILETLQGVQKRAPVTSVRRNGKGQEEASAQQVSTRRSVRLLEKTLFNLSLNDKEMVQTEVVTIDQKVEDQVEKKDVESGSVGQDVSDNVQHQAGSEDSHVMEKPNQDSEKPVDSENVAGLHEKYGGCKPSDMRDGSPDHLDNNSEDIHDVSVVETSEGSFVGEEIGEQVDLLVSKPSDMEVPKLAVASLEPFQDENVGSENVEDIAYEASERKDSAVEDNKGLSDDEDQGILQTENRMKNLKESYEKSSDYSDIEEPMHDENTASGDDVEDLGYEVLARKDSAVEDNRGLSNDDHCSYDQSSDDSDVEEPMQDENTAAEDDVEDLGYEVSASKDSAVEDNRGLSDDEDQGSYDQFSYDSDAEHDHMNEESHAHTGDAAAAEAHFEAYSSEDDLKEMEKCYFHNPTPVHLLDTDPSERAPQLAPSQEKVQPIQGDKSIFEDDVNYDLETLSGNGESDAKVATEVFDPILGARAHEQMNTAGMKSITDMKNNEAEESSITCDEAPSAEVADMRHNEIEGSSSLVTGIVPPVLAESELAQPTRSSSTVQKLDQVDQNKENLGVSVKKKEKPELVSKSMRYLRKMLAEKLSKLDINDSAENTEEDERLGKVAAKVRPALQILPENRIPESEALENC